MSHPFKRRLRDDPIAKQWHSQRANLKDQEHFTRYRQNVHYESYHEAAKAVASGTQSPEQQIMVNGLNSEVGASRVIVPAGQIVFHGRADLDLHAAPTYPSFVSTSLEPTVSIYHAVKRGLKSKSHLVIYLLVLTNPLPAIWGNGGIFEEWELLLKSDLACAHVQTHPGTYFDVVVANIGG